MMTIPHPTPQHNGHMPPTALPEAPCSITLRLPVPGTADHALITGRGQSGPEAAAQWQATRDALLDVLAPPDRLTRLTRLLQCGAAKALAQQDHALLERLAQAYTLVARGLVEPTETPAVMAIRDTDHPGTWHEVALAGLVCSCETWHAHHRAGEAKFHCMHSLAVLMHQRLGIPTQQDVAE